MKVKEMNKQERPREKAMTQGIGSLSNRELLAILLRSGTKEKSALELADEILHKKHNLNSLIDLRLEDLMQIKGVKGAKATQLLTCFELTKRILYERVQGQYVEDNDHMQVITEWLINLIGHEEQEHFIVIFLNNRGKMIAYKDLFIGTGSSSYANPREVFMEALHHKCSKIICVHNHPSGDVTPSHADIQSADNLECSGDMLGIGVIDHLIVSRNTYYSFREHFKMRDQRYQLEDELFDELKEIGKQKSILFPE